MLILTVLVFLSVRFLPGDALDAILSNATWVGETSWDIDREGLRKFLGLDVPAHVQYGRWLKDIFLHGTLGLAVFGHIPIEERILARLPVTVELAVMAIVIGQLIALPAGVYAAIRQDTAADYVGRSVAILGMATPNFWLAIMVMVYPVIWWGWSPSMEMIHFTEDPLGNLKMFIVPAMIMGTALSAGMMRLTRTMMLEVLRQDYIRTARSKGLRERVVVLRHAVKNAFIPIVTAMGGELPMLVGGSVIMENIFNLPGLGQLFLNSVENRDYRVISGVNLVYASVVMGSNLFIDLLYPYLDPRVRYS
jgi:peptide/nickel transport system permease protein